MMERAVFLDRDGTILVERGHVSDAADLALLPGAAPAIRGLQADGWKILVVTNQSHVARGLVTMAELVAIHRSFERMLSVEGVRLDGIYFCPHHPEGAVAEYTVACECRKPRPGLVLRAAREHNISLSRSVLVGDALRDLQAGQSAGVGATILVRTGHGVTVEPQSHGADHVADDLAAAARWISLRDAAD